MNNYSENNYVNAVCNAYADAVRETRAKAIRMQRIKTFMSGVICALVMFVPALIVVLYKSN